MEAAAWRLAPAYHPSPGQLFARDRGLSDAIIVLHANEMTGKQADLVNTQRCKKEAPMTYDRMEAKPIPGEICRFCGDDSAPLVKTPCCDQWICCDTSYLSYRGGGYCQFEHENYSICHFHYNENHHGRWQDCKACRDFFGEDEFNRIAEDRMNTPRY